MVGLILLKMKTLLTKPSAGGAPAQRAAEEPRPAQLVSEQGIPANLYPDPGLPLTGPLAAMTKEVVEQSKAEPAAPRSDPLRPHHSDSR